MPRGALLSIGVLLTSGCWVPPNAHVQPKGDPHLIREGIVVDSSKDPAAVQEQYVTERST